MLLKQPGPVGRRPSCALLGLAMAASLSSAASAQGTSRSSGLVPTLDSAVNYLDTRRFGAEASVREVTAELRPGVQFRSRSGPLQGVATYSLGLVHRSRTDPRFEAQHQLSAALTGQLIERRAFVDISASIAKQSISAFGQQSFAEQNSNNPNRQEVATLSISPSLRGSVGSWAVYDLRLTAAGTNTRKSIEGDSTSKGGSLSLRSPNPRAFIGWGFNASSTTTDFRTTGDSTNDRAVASLELNPDVDLGMSLRAGREATEIGFSGRRSFDTWGGSVRWTPSPRTAADVSADRRFFGRAHNISLSHRLPMSSLRFNSVRDVSLSADPNSLVRPFTLYDLFFEQFASQEPDPVLRQQLVLSFLAGLGLDPSIAVGAAVVNRGPTVQERNDIGWTYSGRRLSLSAQAYAGSTRQLDNDLSAAREADVQQRGYTGSVSYRLTPTASASVVGSRLMTKSTARQPGTDLKSLGLTLSERIGPYATAALNARYSVFNSLSSPYRETALGASLGLRF